LRQKNPHLYSVRLLRLLEPRGPQPPPAEARKRASQAASENPACPAAMLQTKNSGSLLQTAGTGY